MLNCEIEQNGLNNNTEHNNSQHDIYAERNILLNISFFQIIGAECCCV
jgi:hypothetical protein